VNEKVDTHVVNGHGSGIDQCNGTDTLQGQVLGRLHTHATQADNDDPELGKLGRCFGTWKKAQG